MKSFVDFVLSEREENDYIKTSWDFVDDAFYRRSFGYKNSYTVLGGEEKAGKTTAMIAFICEWIKNNTPDKFAILFYSLDTSINEIYASIAANILTIEKDKIMKLEGKDMSKEEKETFPSKWKEVEKYDINLRDMFSPKNEPKESYYNNFRTSCTNFVVSKNREGKHAIIILDHSLSPPNELGGEKQTIDAYSHFFVNMTNSEHKCSPFLITQFNDRLQDSSRQATLYQPNKSDIKQTRNLAADCHLMLLLHRPDMHDDLIIPMQGGGKFGQWKDTGDSFIGQMQLIAEVNRIGAKQKTKVRFDIIPEFCQYKQIRKIE